MNWLVLRNHGRGMLDITCLVGIKMLVRLIVIFLVSSVYICKNLCKCHLIYSLHEPRMSFVKIAALFLAKEIHPCLR
jgi:hypothetical protein